MFVLYPAPSARTIIGIAAAGGAIVLILRDLRCSYITDADGIHSLYKSFTDDERFDNRFSLIAFEIAWDILNKR